MSVIRLLACSLVAVMLVPSPADAKKKKGDDDETTAKDDDSGSDDESSSDDEEQAPPKKKPAKDAGASRQDKDFQKQDLNGHDLATTKKENVFEKDRFFVDKSDTEKTEKGTLVQGSLTSTSFAYRESGGNLTSPNMMTGTVPSNSQFSRLFTDLRLQTDFRHIGSGKWDARIDVRGRVVTDPGTTTTGFTPATNSTVQSGFLGQNELELKELWLVRNGKRSDIFIGRQFVADLGALRIDGLRIDYASSERFTLLGFGGLYPIRGSRSITTDYSQLYSADGNHNAAGRFTGAGGFGAAYRTPDMYGSFGGVVLAPFSSESPRVFGTATGYWRVGPKLDFYHFVILDAVGSNAVNAGLTNLSAGINYKPDQRLRGTLSFNRVDTDTLNVQAQAFLSKQDAFGGINNEAYLIRIATNEARASLSAGLGSLQRFELTAAATYRYRGDQALTAPGQMTPYAKLPAASSAEVYFAVTDRHSIADLRLGADFSRIFKVGDATYQRTSSSAFRVFAAHDISDGQGEIEVEGAYSNTRDDDAGKNCDVTQIGTTCFGAAQDSIISVGGNIFYRINRDWFLMGSAFLNRTSIQHTDMGGTVNDPPVTGITGFFRIAYRF